MNKAIKISGNIVFGFLIAAAAISIIMSVSSSGNNGKIHSIFGYKPMIILSGSMSPKIMPGDTIIDKEISPSNIKIGDVVTYRVAENMLITHRIISIENQNGVLMFKAKGDANNTEDPKFISQENIIGKVSFRIPYGGYVTRFISGKIGFVLLILLPVTPLIEGQIKTIIYEYKKEKALKAEDNMDI